MKKLLALLLALLLPFMALAELDEDGDVVVTLPGIEFFFTPPEDMYLLTRESSASAFNALGMSQRETLPVLEQYGICALLFDEAGSCEIQVLAYEGYEADFDELTAYGADLECERLRFQYKDQGYEVLSCESYWAPEGHRFVRLEAACAYEDGTAERFVEYVTAKGGYTVSIYLFSYLDSVTEEQHAIAEVMADSLWIMPAQ